MENQENKQKSAESDHPVYVKQIYPDPTNTKPEDLSTPANNQELRKLKAESELRLAGLRKLPPTSVQVNIVSCLLVLSGAFSLLTSNRDNFISVMFSIAYIVVGIGLYLRTELARKVVVVVSVINLIFSVPSLIGFGFLAGRKTLVDFASIIFTIIVSMIVLGIFMDDNVKDEFH